MLTAETCFRRPVFSSRFLCFQTCPSKMHVILNYLKWSENVLKRVTWNLYSRAGFCVFTHLQPFYQNAFPRCSNMSRTNFSTFQGCIRKMNFILNDFTRKFWNKSILFHKTCKLAAWYFWEFSKNTNYQMYVSHTVLNKGSVTSLLKEKYGFDGFIFHPFFSFFQN